MPGDHKIQILVAIIGFIGTIIASVIGNWDKLKSTKNNPITIKQETPKEKDVKDNITNNLSIETLVPINYYGEKNI